MQRVFLLVCLLAGLLEQVQAQQNLFNVPTSELTRRRQVLFQQQVTFSGDEIQSNTTFTYGIGRNLEFGFNVFDAKLHTHPLGAEINSDEQRKPLYPFLLFNAQKGFYLNEIFSAGIGGQFGFHASKDTDKVRTGGYYYGNLITDLPGANTRLITGVYHADKTLFGEGRRNDFFVRPPGLGIQLGVQQPLIPNSVFIVADYLGGTHDFGTISTGLDIRLQDNWEVAVGYQFRNPGGSASSGLVIQFTMLP